MGKAADNERVKLSAMFWNNLAVGAALTGVIGPGFGLLRLIADHREVVNRAIDLTATWDELKQPFILLVALFFTAVAGLYYSSEFRKLADGYASRIKG
jgi:hypothetical protein